MEMVTSVLIENGTVVTATDCYIADVYIEGEKIHTIGKNLRESFVQKAENINIDKIIDATGHYLFPGGIDPHTHMELPFMGTHSSDTFETGTLAGLYGGTTTIIDFAIQTQGESLNAGLDAWHEKADGKAVGDYAFHLAVTDFNDKTESEIQDIIQKRGVSSFKVFMAYKGALMVDDLQIARLMEASGKFGGMVIAHTENGDMVEHNVAKLKAQSNLTPKYHALSRPPICEAEAAGRFLDLAHHGQHPCYIVHLTCEESLDRVREAMKRNQQIFVETCIQYLMFNDAQYELPGFEGAKWIFSPPLRKPKDQEALWHGMNQNIIHTVATDHCPFCMKQKEIGQNDFSKIPNGAPGIENRFELMYSEGVEKGRLSLNKFVDVTSTAAAKIFGLFPRKGTIAVGSDADIVIYDPKAEHVYSVENQHMNCDYSAYEGWQVKGKCKTVLLRGTVAIEDGHAKIGKGFGQYIHRAPVMEPLLDVLKNNSKPSLVQAKN